MTDGVRVDDSDLRVLSRDLTGAAVKALPEVRKVIQRGALNIKRDMQEDAGGHPHFPHFPSSITYDTKLTPGGIEAEIGPDKSRPQGALGNILYFGTSNNAPVLDIEVGIRAEEPRLDKHLSELSTRLLGL